MKLDRVIAVRNNKIVYRDEDKVIKIFDEEFKKADVLNEALNHARVEETPLNIPKLLEVTMVNGRWAIITEYIPGKTLARLMAENPAQHDAYMNTFVDLQLRMRRQSVPLLSRLRDKMDQKIGACDLDATTRYDLHTRLEALPRQNMLCHGDYNPSNIIITPEGVPYILDWSHATQGNGAADAARTYLLFRLQGEDRSAETYLNLFLEKSDTPRQVVLHWIPIVAASQSVKGRPEEREMLLKFVDVVDYE